VGTSGLVNLYHDPIIIQDIDNLLIRLHTKFIPSSVEIEGSRLMNEYTFTSYHYGFKQNSLSTEAEMNVLIEGLGRNILKQLGDVELGKSLRIFLHDKENKVVGGIAADLFGDWAYISLLWVEESLRNKGLGSELLCRLESEAIQMGCTNAHLDTYSFEAKPFYEKAGYKVFGKLDDYPVGYCKYFLTKALK
jgi:GNAT superfamily N-acetyltransferase